MVSVNNINFPVNCFSQSYILIYQTQDELTTCGVKELKDGLYKNMIIVDSNENGYKLKDSSRIKYVGPFWGFRLFYSRQITVELIFESGPFHVSLEKLKELICDAIDKGPEFWSSAGDIDELKAETRKANTFHEVIHMPFF